MLDSDRHPKLDNPEKPRFSARLRSSAIQPGGFMTRSIVHSLARALEGAPARRTWVSETDSR
jgi:hypothetical protein